VTLAALLISVCLAAGAILIVVWLVYPLTVLRLGASPEQRPTAHPSGMYRVDVIVATMNPPGEVSDRVRDLLCADYLPGRLGVVVSVDSRSKWAPDEYRFDDPRVRLVRGDLPGGKAATLNAAVSLSDADVLVFADVAQRFHPSAISDLVQSLVTGSSGIVSGRLVLPVDQRSALIRWYTEIELALRRAEATIDSAVGVSGSIYATWRRLWTPLPANLILDDLFVPMRLVLQGERVGFANGALAYETRRVTPGQEYRRKVRTLTGVIQLCAWLPAVLNPWRNRIWVQFVCHKLLRLLTPYCIVAGGLSAVGLFVLLFRQYAWVAGISVLAMSGLLTLSRDRVSRRLRGVLLELTALQAAVIRATVNGLRGRWDVWHQ
jgi:biofilm PGA synthesis N-glycosyltransferase PgaC